MMHSLPDNETLYNALLQKDSTFEGIFVAGVKTTGIFCRATCTARKPKQENVEFFPSAREALMNGYRPCKICNPLGYKGEVPDWLRPLLDEIDSTPGIRLRDHDLKQRGIDPNRARRWFQKHHKMTFQTYVRTLRIGQAFGRIQYGGKVIDAAFESGYDSLGGFTESFKKTTGFSPNSSKHNQLITITRILTPLGPMLAGATDNGVCLLEFIDRKMLEMQLSRLKRMLKAELVPGSNRHFEALHRQVQEYFAGKRKEFILPLVMQGTPFQQEVWKALQAIPYGETRSYQEQAEMLGKPRAVRAVAQANGDNRISIIIPCHRVIGKDGKLVGYGGGLWRKKFLLDLESRAQLGV
jgi:AraC family transcriptional regulator, regulatory protein of adaptative response / methylated-DNA-[protein]-cysteine methyltransferase